MRQLFLSVFLSLPFFVEASLLQGDMKADEFIYSSSEDKEKSFLLKGNVAIVQPEGFSFSTPLEVSLRQKEEGTHELFAPGQVTVTAKESSLYCPGTLCFIEAKGEMVAHGTALEPLLLRTPSREGVADKGTLFLIKEGKEWKITKIILEGNVSLFDKERVVRMEAKKVEMTRSPSSSDWQVRGIGDVCFKQVNPRDD